MSFQLEYTPNIVAISQTTELLLSSGIPSIEANLTEVGVKSDRMNFLSTLAQV
jgi:hypothetical protein